MFSFVSFDSSAFQPSPTAARTCTTQWLSCHGAPFHNLYTSNKQLLDANAHAYNSEASFLHSPDFKDFSIPAILSNPRGVLLGSL